MARPTKLTPELSAAIVALVEAGNYPECAAEAEGIDGATYYRWMQRGESDDPAAVAFREFRESITRARAKAESAMVSVIRTDALENAESARWILERSKPDRWGRRDHVVVENRVREELDQSLAKLQRDLTPDAYAQVIRSLAGVDDAGAGPAPAADAADE